MALFTKSADLFELIDRPSSDDSPIEGSDQLLTYEGKTIVIIDDWPENGTVTVQQSAEISLRKDTAVVISVVAAVLVVCAFLAGRATVRAKQRTGAQAATKAPLPKGVFDPTQTPANPATPSPQPQPQPQFQAPAPQPQPGPQTAPPQAATTPQRQVTPGKYELQVVTTRPEKARAVVEFINKDPSSPIAARLDLEAYVRGSRAVRIRGFKDRDNSVLGGVKRMKDPTGGGHFKQALYLTVSR